MDPFLRIRHLIEAALRDPRCEGATLTVGAWARPFSDPAAWSSFEAFEAALRARSVRVTEASLQPACCGALLYVSVVAGLPATCGSGRKPDPP